METGITARRQETSMQQHKPSHFLSKQTEIVKLLTKFSLSRRAAINPETLTLDAADLSTYEVSDIAEALETLRKQGRADGESAYPEIHAFLEAVRGVTRLRGDRRAIDAENERIAHFKAHPEMYETTAEVAEMAKKINERFGMERPKVIDTTPMMQVCPHCAQELPVAPNIRLWSVKEGRDYFDLLESNQAIAAANREASLAAQAAEGVV